MCGTLTGEPEIWACSSILLRRSVAAPSEVRETILNPITRITSNLNDNFENGSRMSCWQWGTMISSLLYSDSLIGYNYDEQGVVNSVLLMF